jgi:transcriptional regulator with XRE-family HTH domain
MRSGPPEALSGMRIAKPDYARRCAVMLTTSNTSFGIQVRMARAGLAWSQADLASRSGVSARTVKNVEADRRKPRSETQAKISDALANAGADLDGDCSVRIRGEVRSTPSAVVETSSECRP